MTTNKEKIIFKELSYKVVGLAMEVHKKLGYGFLEKVYENAMMILLEKEGIHAEQQVPISVYFEGGIFQMFLAGEEFFKKEDWNIVAKLCWLFLDG